MPAPYKLQVTSDRLQVRSSHEAVELRHAGDGNVGDGGEVVAGEGEHVHLLHALHLHSRCGEYQRDPMRQWQTRVLHILVHVCTQS